MKPIGVPKTITLEQSESVKRYMQEVKNYGPLNKKEELETIKLAQSGNAAAREKIIKHNLRFVITIAKRYQHGYGHMLLVDLIQLGNIGLMRAVDRFDLASNLKFITFAVWWIRKTIMEEMDQYNAPIKYPHNFFTTAAKIREIKNRFEQVAGYEPTSDQIEDLVPESDRRVLEYGDLYTNRFVHLDKPFPERNGNFGGQEITMNDYMVDESAVATDSGMDTDDQKLVLERLFKCLNAREKEIMFAFYGFGGEDARNTDNIGDKLGITAVRVRQLMAGAVKKMQARAAELNYNPVF